MDTISSLGDQISKARNELRNIRQSLTTLKHVHKKDVGMLRRLVEEYNNSQQDNRVTMVMGDTPTPAAQTKPYLSPTDWKPIGHIKSVFKTKNGTPRQANVCETSKAVLELRKDLFTNPEHALEGIENYSHIWVIYIFHKNNCDASKAKVKPPRLDGSKVGLFSTRSPHRPNPIGLSLVKLDQAKGPCLYLSGVDILDGTPVLDIKPYIPDYDKPKVTTAQHPANSTPPSNAEINTYPAQTQSDTGDSDTNPTNSASVPNTETDCSTSDDLRCADWVTSPPIPPLDVVFTARASADLDRLLSDPETPKHQVQGKDAVLDLVRSILTADPRSTYRRQHCQDRLYYFSVDHFHVTCWFDENVAEVLKIKSAV